MTQLPAFPATVQYLSLRVSTHLEIPQKPRQILREDLIDQLDKVTAVIYDAGGNQLTVRDPNNVGADMVYDSLGRNTQRTE